MFRQPSNTVIYEQPLNERMRAFLRLEHLFTRAEHRLHDHDMWSSRTTLEAIIDMMALMGRADLRTELIQELDRQATSLEALARNPKVDRECLQTILDRMRELAGRLRASDSTPGFELRRNDFLSTIRQRYSLLAGTCNFDLPAFHFWLQSPPDQRINDLKDWLSAFDIVRDTISLCLSLVRDSATATRETAVAGFYQKALGKETSCQMVRVGLPAEAHWYPETSAGRHRFAIRFMRHDSAGARPSQTKEDVEFDLLCCVI